jgi:hypothetical protein
VQVNGCAPLMAKKPARAEPAPPPAAVSTATPAYAYRAPELGLIVPSHGSPLGRASLVVDEDFKLKLGVDTQVRIHAACRYDARSRTWSALPVPADALEVAGPGLMNRVRVAYRFPEGERALLGALDGRRAHHFAHRRGGRFASLPDGRSSQPAAGEISLCVPGSGAAQAGRRSRSGDRMPGSRDDRALG